MKKRVRLSPEKAAELGFEVKPKEGNRNARYYIDVPNNKQFKVLLLDIETAPMRSYTWSCWKQNVGTNQIITDWFILTWSAKWLFDKEVISDRLTDKEVLQEDDKRITKRLWNLLNETDVVIAHNGDKFDIRKVNTRFLIHRLGTPSSYQSIDTLKHARKQLSFSSNRLDYLGEILGLGRKIDTGGFELWSRCMQKQKQCMT